MLVDDICRGDWLEKILRKDPQNKSLRSVVLFLAASILLQIFFIKPFFGLMDDAALLTRFLPDIIKNGFWYTYFSFPKVDASWGMFRPNFVPMIYLLYSVGVAFGPTAFFLLNAFLVLIIIYLNAFAFSKLLNVNRWLIFLFSLCFPYTYDFFQHPSLQEKLVIFFWRAPPSYLPKSPP